APPGRDRSCGWSRGRAARRGSYHLRSRGMDDRLAARLELANLSDEEFVRGAYRLVLRRDPEPAAFDRRVSRATLLAEPVARPEFAELRALDDALMRMTAAARFLEAPPGLDERAIEIPWALSRIGNARRVLDI